MKICRPKYLSLSTQDFEEKIQESYTHFSRCQLCPHQCKANRQSGKLGFCQMGSELRIHSYFVHMGEEPPISGESGSGTIFFTGCTMRCLFCQNYQISQLHRGQSYTPDNLADMFLELQEKGCHNINLVSPTLWVPHIIKALSIAKEKGLTIPIVYNSSGYESTSTLKLLDGLIDIYLPDIKYSSDHNAYECSGIHSYVASSRSAILEMHRQVGHLCLDDEGIAHRGILVRHLVLPKRLSGAIEFLEFIKNNLGLYTHIGIMSQYTPLFKASTHKDLKEKTSYEEYQEVLDYFEDLGFINGWYQEFEEVEDEDQQKFIFDFKE